MKSFLLTIIFSALLMAQPQNVAKLGSLNPYPGTAYSNCWGYTDQNGREYALLGHQNGTAIIDITNAASPVLITNIAGPNSIWREIKTHSTYMYVVTEGTGTGKGLQIVDLSQLPASATLVKTVTTWFQRGHDLFTADGYLYVVGTDNGGGMHVIDLADPINPVRKSYYTASGYIHDIYVYNDTCYASSEDTYDVIDLKNKANPVRVSQSAALPGIYAHSGWLSEDKRYFWATEEFNVRDLTVWDLQDRHTWNLIVPNWQMPGDSPIHNLYIKGPFAHVSYYKDGYVVLDVTNPTNPTRVGWYDTFPATTGTYDGAWGVYPYFASGKVIVSDISTGLYIFDFLLDNTVPVELRSCTATLSNSNVLLNWSTATETNNRGFHIQRSSNGTQWSSLAFIAGNGTTTKINYYTFRDGAPLAGVSYYRLVQEDLNGDNTTYSPVTVHASADELLAAEYDVLQNFPNPFNPSTTIRFNLPAAAAVTLTVTDMLGRAAMLPITGTYGAGKHEVAFTASALPSGTYFARLETGGKSKTIKMILAK